MSEYFPEVAWRTIVDKVTVTATPYYYTVDVFPLDSNEPGADPLDIAVGYWLIDNGGYTYLITDISGSTITVYDINERSWGDSYIGPLEDLPGYVYKTKNGAFLLSQSQLRFLDKSAPDILYPIEKGIIWKYRGVEINALYGDGEAVETIAEDSIDNITKLSLSPEFILRTEEDGWQGGKKYSLSLEGLLHNTLPDIQGTRLGDDYIHLDQDQIDALWTKDGLNITRDSAASLTGILSVDEIKSYTGALPLIKKDGNNVRFSTCILSDCINDRVGIFTETPLDHLHLTGYARISTLAETDNSSLVTSNADGRLIKLPYDNNESKYLRSDGTWAAIITSTGDFLDSVIRMVVNSTFNPGTPSNGDRYIILNTASIHTNFGIINKFSDGSALTLGNNDIVQYYSAHSEFRIVYDASAAMQPATVTVGTDKNGNTNHQWTYNVTSDIWVDRGAAINHNSLDGLNDGDYKHLTAAQYTNFISLTGGSDVSNTLHNHNTQYAIKQSSTTDTTSGRGLIVGAFGLGGDPIILTSSEWDAISMPNQFVRATNSSDSIFNRAGVGIHLKYSIPYAAQLFMAVTGTLSIKARATSGSGVWGTAQELYHTGNLVNPVTGTGTAGYLPKFTGASALGNSVIYETGGNVLIGTTTDSGAKLEVVGAVSARFGNTPGGGVSNAILFDRLASNDSLNFGFREGTTTKAAIGLRGNTNGLSFTIGSMISANVAMYIDTNKNVAIGKTSVTSGYMLDVNGAIIATGGNSTNWNTAYSERNRWDGGSAGLDAATGRASLGLTDAVLGTGSAGKVAWWSSATGLNWTSKLTYDFANSSLRHQGHTTLNGTQNLPVTGGTDINGSLRIGGVGTNISMDIGVTAIPGAYGPWFQGRNTGDQSYYYPIFLNPNGGGAAIGKMAVTSGYTLDVNGAIQSTGLKIGTLSGLLKVSSGVVGTATAGTDYQAPLTNPITGTGTANQIAYFTGATSLASLSTATYPSLTELSRVKGVTSSIQTQLNNKQATLTNPVTGTGSAGQISYWNDSGSQTGSSNLVWDNTNGRLSIISSNMGAGFAVLGSNIGIRQNNSETNGIIWKNFGYTKMSAGLLPIDTGGYATQGLGFYTGDDNNTTTDAQLRMSILRNGTVAIGKTSVTSGYTLDVNGAIRAAGNIYATGNIRSGNQSVFILSSSSTITWDVNNNYNAKITLNRNVTLTVTGASAGDSGTLMVIQDATGNRTLTLNSAYYKESGNISLSTMPNSIDILGWYYDGSNYYWNIGLDYKL